MARRGRPTKEAQKAKTLEAIRDAEELLRLWRSSDLKMLGVAERAQVYEEIVEVCTEGYKKTIVTPKGEVVTYTEYDHATAVKALGDYGKLVDATLDRVDTAENFEVLITVEKAQPKVIEPEGDD